MFGGGLLTCLDCTPPLAPRNTGDRHQTIPHHAVGLVLWCWGICVCMRNFVPVDNRKFLLFFLTLNTTAALSTPRMGIVQGLYKKTQIKMMFLSLMSVC